MSVAASLPPAPQVTPKPPRRWLGPKGGWIVFAGCTAVWLFSLIFDVTLVHETSISPNALILSGVGMSVALMYTMAYRLRPQDGISVGRLFLAFTIGGFISTELAGTANFLINSSTGGRLGSPDLVSTTAVGFVEELSKIIAVVVVSRGLADRSPRNGLFIGGAVGLGFAALEDMEYIAASYNNGLFANHAWSVIFVTAVRDLIGPFEHPIFTALLAAALFAGCRNGRFRITPILLGTYVSLAVVHSVIDSTYNVVWFAGHNYLVTEIVGNGTQVFLAIAAGLVWWMVARRLKRSTLDAELATPAASLV